MCQRVDCGQGAIIDVLEIGELCLGMPACGRLPHNLPIRKFNGFRFGPDFPTPRGAFTKPPTGRVCRRWGWRKAVVARWGILLTGVGLEGGVCNNMH